MYAPLMHWLKATDHVCYEKLLEVYTNSICKLYEQHLRSFFEEARSKVIALREKKFRKMRTVLFAVLEPELVSFLAFLRKLIVCKFDIVIPNQLFFFFLN